MLLKNGFLDSSGLPMPGLVIVDGIGGAAGADGAGEAVGASLDNSWLAVAVLSSGVICVSSSSSEDSSSPKPSSCSRSCRSLSLAASISAR